MSDKPGADDKATDTDKPTPEQAHNRLIGRLLAGEDPDAGGGAGMSRPTPPSPWPLTAPTTPAGKEAAKLHADWVKQFAWAEKLDGEYRDAQRAVRAADEDLRNATSPKAAEQAEAALAKARQVLDEPWRSRAVGPYRAVEAARAAFNQHVDSHLGELLSELEVTDAAAQAREQVVASLESVVAAVAAWNDARQSHADILRVAGQIDAGRALPDLPDRVRELARSAEGALIGRDKIEPPVPLDKHLDQRAVIRGEAVLQSLDSHGISGVRLIRE